MQLEAVLQEREEIILELEAVIMNRELQVQEQQRENKVMRLCMHGITFSSSRVNM